MHRLTPHMMMLAYKIHWYATPRGWDCTAGEIAEAIGSTPIIVGRVCTLKGWAGRLRTTRQEHFPGGGSLGLAGAETLDPSGVARFIDGLA